MDQLRSPGGCPWDAQQTHDSLATYLLEETYETLEAIDSGDRVHLREELGDLLLQVVFHARIATEHPDDPWTIDDVAAEISDKLVRRHPHVFGDATARSAAHVEAAWDRLKAAEKQRTSALDGIPAALPALSLATKTIGRAERAEVGAPVPPLAPRRARRRGHGRDCRRRRADGTGGTRPGGRGRPGAGPAPGGRPLRRPGAYPREGRRGRADMTAPDLVLTGGPVLRDDTMPQHGLAVAVTAGRIAAVGPAADVLALRAARTEVIDLRGRLLLPGFVDAHAHPFWGGLERLACDLLDTSRTVRDYQQAVAAAAAARPRALWVTGGGWSFEAFPDGIATADMLDAVVPDRPVVLFNRDHHGVWVNSRALAMAGLDADTADPPDGRIERDRRGRPSGVLHEGAAALVTDLVPAPDDATTDAALRSARDHLVPLGVTGWVEAILGEYAGQPDPLPTYLRAWAAGTLDVRSTGALWWDRTRGVEQIADIVARRDLAASHGVALVQVKIMADGIIENQTAAMLTDYLRDGVPTGERGLSFVERAALLEAVPALEVGRRLRSARPRHR